MPSSNSTCTYHPQYRLFPVPEETAPACIMRQAEACAIPEGWKGSYLAKGWSFNQVYFLKLALPRVQYFGGQKAPPVVVRKCLLELNSGIKAGHAIRVAPN